MNLIPALMFRTPANPIPRLELQYRLTDQQDAPPVLFVHGIFSGAWIWAEYYLDWFAQQGFHAYALSFRGHGQSSAPDPLGQYSLQEYVQDLADAIRTIEQSHGQQPLLVGHSMGGMVVQSYLSQYRGRGALLLASIPPQGLLPVSFSSFLSNPLQALSMSKNYLLPETVAPHEFAHFMFARPVNGHKMLQWMQQMVRESLPLLWDMSWQDLPAPWAVARTPLVVVGARHDRLIPPDMVQLTASTYGTQAYWLDTGHGMMLEENWQEGAEQLVELLQKLVLKTR
ncbi:alpha/beta hydrolase [Marinospirillum alkaliphilum]|uniref:Non-heme chloroperoxidase n=1 Tax=Marinospirillum alkaliphilum DSM 21637 TaxID=1122209 RepID=A0A1K1TID8_9GAMM|nr:alpha/beta fold hydrolase [Marinospirillum alkaliphilum]SFX00302.1 non-heme chloroperoxidase [Marinospirillum alkaliphilum DSM 21637]